MSDQNFKKWRDICFNFQPGIKWLVSDVIIGRHSVEGTVSFNDEFRTGVKALWDTGSTTTIICPEIVKALGLNVESNENVMHLLGHGKVNTYYIDLFLPELVVFQKVKVLEMPIRNKHFDMIIGMDIIQRGDFRIKNIDNKITMSFKVTPECKITLEK